MLLVLATVQAEDALYRCDEGSFTNCAEAGCASYQTQGSVTVSPDGQPSTAIRERARFIPTITAVLPPPSGKVPKNGSTLCGLYDEWQTLRRMTNGGVMFQRGRDVTRWQALSRIFQYIDPPQCDVEPTVRAAHASR